MSDFHSEDAGSSPVKVTTYYCLDCERPFNSSQSLNSHRRHCRLKKEGKTWLDTLSEEAKNKITDSDTSRRKQRKNCLVCEKTVKDLEAKYCSSRCFGLDQNKSPHTQETKDKIRASLKGRKPSNTGKTKSGLPKTPQNCYVCEKGFIPSETSIQCCSITCGRIKAAITRKSNKTSTVGGYREGSGRSKSGWFNGIFCGSTYELIFVIYNLEHGIKVERCKKVLDYVFEGKQHKYHPDFEFEDDIFEVKGFWTKQAEAKRDQHPEIVVIDKNKILWMRGQCSLKDKTQKDLLAMYEVN